MKRLKRLLPIAMVVAMLSVLLMPAGVAFAADLTSVSATVAPTTVSTSSNMTVNFTTATLIPNGGKIVITALDFTWGDAGTDNTTVNDGASVNLTSATSSDTNKQVVIVLESTENISASTAVTVVLGASSKYLTNPANEGSYAVSIDTQNSAGTAIDEGSCQVTVGDGNRYEFAVNGETLTLTAQAPAAEDDITISRSSVAAGTDLTSDTHPADKDQNGVWKIVDARGTEVGWYITAGVGSLTEVGGSHTYTPDATDANWTSNTEYAFQLKISEAASADGASDVWHTNSDDGSGTCVDLAGTSAAYVYLIGSPQTIVSAASTEGLGAFTILPDIKVTVPAGIYAATYYIQLTLTLYDVAE